MRGPVVAVIGQGSPEGGPVIEGARAVGTALAERGATVVTGGLGGVMNAASEGARRAGGRVVAIIPGTDRSAATAHADIVICTGVGEARNLAVVASADAAIAVGGAWGTLSEIALASRLGRPVVLLASWSVRAPDEPLEPAPLAADSPSHAVDLALEAIG
ncbi:MAG: hypothetical protein ACR2N6_03475 [Miltoncostaeaceae bacterium]